MLPAILTTLAYADLIRIDAALEGAWSETVTPVWTRETGFLGFAHVPGPQPGRRPALELYFPGYWVGLHCFREEDGSFVFDPSHARDVVSHVEAAVRNASAARRSEAE
jgi:hypothetical protein